jgi:hypothetical protein
MEMEATLVQHAALAEKDESILHLNEFVDLIETDVALLDSILRLLP